MREPEQFSSQGKRDSNLYKAISYWGNHDRQTSVHCGTRVGGRSGDLSVISVISPPQFNSRLNWKPSCLTCTIPTIITIVL